MGCGGERNKDDPANVPAVVVKPEACNLTSSELYQLSTLWYTMSRRQGQVDIRYRPAVTRSTAHVK